MDIGYESELRAAAMGWLSRRSAEAGGFRLFARPELLEGFTFAGRRVPLVATRQGIWKPRDLTAALSILTVFTPAGQKAPYADAVGADGLARYAHRGQNAQHADNRALRAAWEYRLPLMWFIGVAPGVYEAIRPVWLIDEEPAARAFVVAVDQSQRSAAVGDATNRAYVEQVTKQRVHQPVFRAQVISAYGTCAICRLKYPSLLDAAHILRDGHPRGDPVVQNGLALCKIHHAAFDQNLIGVRPDRLVVEVRKDVRLQSDGPMLLHGLQEMQGIPLVVPASRRARPDPTRLEERWEEFRRAG